MHIPHNRIHRVMKSDGSGEGRAEEAEEEEVDPLREEVLELDVAHGLDAHRGDGWLIAYLDDASRFVVGYGLFPEATSEHAVEVLKEAIKKHGRPASILTDRGIQFYAVEADDRLRGLTVFEKYLIENEIRQVLSRVSHPQTNGKVERFFRTVKDKLGFFKTSTS